MNKIEKMHLDSITKAEYDTEDKQPNYVGFAEECSKLTEQITIEFAEWCESNAAREKSGMWMMYSNPTILITKEQLFQEFLKTKQ